MANIELVIKIPEKEYRNICLMSKDGIGIALYDWVANGTPLPKGHGDLIDRKELKKEVYTTTEWNGDVHKIIYEASVDDAEAIIEAEGENEKEPDTEPDLEV